MRRLLPQSLAGRLIVLLILAIVVSQAVSFAIFFDERRIAIHSAAREQIVSRTASIVLLLERTPASLHQRVLETASSRRLLYSLDAEPAVAATPGSESNRLARELQVLIGDPSRSARVVIWQDEPADGWPADWRRRREHHERMHDGFDDDDDDDDEHQWRDRRRWWPVAGLSISVGPIEGRWLNAVTVTGLPPTERFWPPFFPVLLMALAIAVTVILAVRRITRPLSRLADAADRLGRGEEIDPLPDEGPAEVRRTTQAFNRMRDRLQRFVADRTRLLAAISHDLRTPITTLRLRAELLDDDEARERMLATLDEMERMTEATLAFAREEAQHEDTRTVDLSALVASLCADLADLGHAVEWTDGGPLPFACRPTALKRALRNVVENAVRYGEHARVAILPREDVVTIAVDDDGPGIAAADRERVFEPFVRLDESRNPETGGIGLGLAIARSIVRGHGGDLTLENRDEGGLRATIRLPRRSAA